MSNNRAPRSLSSLESSINDKSDVAASNWSKFYPLPPRRETKTERERERKRERKEGERASGASAVATAAVAIKRNKGGEGEIHLIR